MQSNVESSARETASVLRAADEQGERSWWPGHSAHLRGWSISPATTWYEFRGGLSYEANPRGKLRVDLRQRILAGMLERA